jgi:hypothetical protein
MLLGKCFVISLLKGVFYFFLFFLLSNLSPNFTFAQSKQVIGRVLDSVSLKAIPDMLVVNKSSGLSTITDAEGFFYIKMKKEDTLVLYLLAYLPKNFYFKSSEEFDKQAHLIVAKADIQQLKEVEIMGKRNKNNYAYPMNTVPAGLSNPISFLYERYNKKYQQYAKLQEIIEKKEQEKYINELRNKRLSKDLIMAVTDIEPSEVDEFIKKSNFNKQLLENANDYELIVEVIKKYKWWSDRR